MAIEADQFDALSASQLPLTSHDIVEMSTAELPPNTPKYAELGQSVVRSITIAEWLTYIAGNDNYTPYDQN